MAQFSGSLIYPEGHLPTYIETNGSGNEVWLLLHGIGATGAAWSIFEPLLRQEIDCRTIIIDLPGHGHSDRLDVYTEESVAQYVADAIALEIESGNRLVLFGHSYGGTIATWLASAQYNLSPDLCLGLGIKSEWSDDELYSIQKISTKPSPNFEDQASANKYYARASGLSEASVDVLARGVKKTQTGWRLSADPKVYNISRPEIKERIHKSVCKVHLSRGADDRMVDLKMLKDVQASSESLADGAHTAMVDAPEQVLEWAIRCRNLYL